MVGGESEILVSKNNRSITDSPGFWLLLFCGFGFCMLWLAHDRIIERLAEKTQAYTAMKAAKANENSKTEKKSAVAEKKNYQVPSLRILFFVLAGGALSGLVLLIGDIVRKKYPLNAVTRIHNGNSTADN